MILKCVARLKSRRKKLSVFTLICLNTRRLNTSADASADTSASALRHQINKQSKRLE